MIAGHILARVPALDTYCEMMVVVPEGPKATERLTTYAKVMAMYYDREVRKAEPPAPERKCLWCENEPIPGRGMLFWSPSPDEPISNAPRGWYCGTTCWLAAS